MARQPMKSTDGEWHQVHIELHGNDVTARIDKLPELHGTGTVLDVKKSRITFASVNRAKSSSTTCARGGVPACRRFSVPPSMPPRRISSPSHSQPPPSVLNTATQAALRPA